jgi:hypothetical protein
LVSKSWCRVSALHQTLIEVHSSPWVNLQGLHPAT